MHVYTLFGAPPEIQAYGLAKYSRSSQSLDQSISELSSQRAEQFLTTFYFQYGHRSIADLAHITMALEDISMLAAFYVVDEPLWDGQGRSSRYQDFRKGGFYVPPEVSRSPDAQTYTGALAYLVERYEHFSSALTDLLREVYPCPPDMESGAYKRTLRARAFDVARYFLPLATYTSNGQITSARVLEQQISRLAAHSLPELNVIAQALRSACQSPAYNYTDSKLKEAVAKAELTPQQVDRLRRQLEESGVLEVHAAPTLVRYTEPSLYLGETLRDAGELLAPYLEQEPLSPDLSSNATLVADDDPLSAVATSLLYLTDGRARRYAQLGSIVSHLTADDKERLFMRSLAQRGLHDDWLRVHRVGYQVVFDLLVDFGALRDLHRHRRCVQIIPDLKLNLGFDDPAVIFEAGLGHEGAKLAAQLGLIDEFGEALQCAIETAQGFPHALYATYLLPLGARQRALFKMDLAEAAYIIEQRTKVGGHFSYRRVAYEMYRQLCVRYPYLKTAINATNPYDVVELLSR